MDASASAAYFTDSVSTSSTAYSSGTTPSLPIGATVEWVSSGSVQISVQGAGFNVDTSGTDIYGYGSTTQSGAIDYVLYALSGNGYSSAALHVSW